MTRNRTWLAIGVAALVATVAVAVGLTRDSVPGNAAFVYGDRTVTKAELNKRVDALRALYGIQAPKGVAKRDEFRRSAAKSYAVTLILDDEARERGIVVSEKRARDLLDKLIEAQFGSRRAFVEALGDVGTSERAVVEEIRRQAVTLALRKKVVGKTTISDAFLRASFERRKGELAAPEQRRLSNIVVATRAEAMAAAQRLEAGEPVATVAAESTIDESTRQSGGDLGYLSARQLEAPVAKAAFGAREGQVYGPAKSSHGWNVGIVAAIRAGQPADFGAVREPLRKQLVAEQESVKWTSWLGEAIRDADVTYAKAYEPADPDAPPPMSPPRLASTDGGQR
jgi:peptidyl-prolyl cis-trans isomerase C